MSRFIERALMTLIRVGGKFTAGADVVLADMGLRDLFPGGTWSGERLLGVGGHGSVYLHECRDSRGQVIDRLAIKEQHWDESANPDDVIDRPGLATEAAINRDLNVRDDDQRINLLRQYKFSRKSNKQRFYMAFAECDLERLRVKYMLYDEYLPELFLWTCLIQLCQAVIILEKSPPEDTVIMRHDENGDVISREELFTLHLDIKPENILLYFDSDQPETGDIPAYPSIRLANFGVSEYTCEADAENPGRFYKCGTEGYMPPEQTKWKASKADGFKGKPPNPPNAQLLKPANVWSIGKVMLELMTHLPWDALKNHMGSAKMTRDHYENLGKHYIKEDWSDILSSLESWESAYSIFPYSRILMDLVRSALKPRAVDRPSTADLLRQAEAGRTEYLQTLRKTDFVSTEKRSTLREHAKVRPRESEAGDESSQERPKDRKHINNSQLDPEYDDERALEEGQIRTENNRGPPGSKKRAPTSWDEATRLYFRENEINNMSQGPAAFDIAYCDKDMYLSQLDWCPPECNTLRGSSAKWGHVQADSRPKMPDCVLDEKMIKMARDERHKKELQQMMEERARRSREELATGPKDVARRTSEDYSNMDGVEIMLEIKKSEKLSGGKVNELMEQMNVQQLRDHLKKLDRERIGKEAGDQLPKPIRGESEPAATEQEQEENPSQPTASDGQQHIRAAPSEDEYKTRTIKRLNADLEARGHDAITSRIKQPIVDELIRLDGAGERGDEAWRKQPKKNKETGAGKVDAKGKRRGEELTVLGLLNYSTVSVRC